MGKNVILARGTFVITNRRAIAMCSSVDVRMSALWSYGAR